MNYDLVDIWGIRNPDSKKFSWRQKSPIIQRRLHYWLISDFLRDDVVKIDIVTAIRTDHQAVTLEIDSLVDQQRGPSFWKFNFRFIERFTRIYEIVLSIMAFPLPLSILNGVFARATHSRHLFS